MRIESGTPVSIDTNTGRFTVWGRLELSEQSFKEDWIQTLIFDEPSALPITEIDPAFAPLLPIGREVATTAGPIDALYVSPDGAITVVEAKLWRNPQSRREVVGQIIDYATALAEWGYDDLDRATRTHTGSSLWDVVATSTSMGSEGSFVDTVARNLRKGRFLLLVVGDGIREEVERMARYVQVAPQLQFSLALVELRVYGNPEGANRLVVPSVVARSEEVVRAVVDVDIAPEATVSVDVSVPAEASTTRGGVLSSEQFFEELASAVPPDLVKFAADFMRRFENDTRYIVEMKAASYVVRAQNPHGGSPLSLLVVTRSGYVYPGWLGQQLPKAGLPPEIGHELVADIAALTGSKVKADDPQWLEANVPLVTVAAVADQLFARLDRFAAEVAELGG